MKIGIKIGISFGIVIILFVLFSVFNIWQIEQYNTQLNQFSRYQLLIEVSKDLQLAVANIRQAFTVVSLTYDEDHIYHDAKLNLSVAHVNREKLISLDQDEDHRKMLKALQVEIDSFFDTGFKMYESFLKDYNLGKPVMEDFNNQGELIFDKLKKLVNEIRSNANRAIGDFSSTAAFGRNSAIALIVLVLIISAVIIILITRYITTSVNKFLYILEKSSSGDLTEKITMKSKDEIGMIGSYINTFIFSLLKMIARLKEMSIKTKRIGQELSHITSETSANMNQMSAAMNSSKDNLNNLNEEVQKSNSSMKELTEAINSISEKMEEQASAVNESSASMEEMASSIQNMQKIAQNKKVRLEDLKKIAGQGLEKMEASIESVNKINNSTNFVLETVEIIDNVSSQTDLLAMNAAIEAAHVGEAGKGFAVVAEEIRKLSDQTQSNSQVVKEFLHKIVLDIQSANELNKETGTVISELVKGIEEVDASMAELLNGMNELALGGNEIVKAIGSLLTIFDKIKQANDEINKNINFISDNIEGVADISDQTSMNLKETSSSSEQINSAMAYLLKIGQQNKDNIETLDNELKKFKTG